MKKRVLSMLMALALCLTLLPAPAWAAEADAPEGGAIVQEEQQQEKTLAAESPAISEQAAENGIAAQNGGGSTVKNAVAEVTIGDTTAQYATLTEAITAAQKSNGSTVKLLADVTTTSEIEVDSGTFTIDLNGKKLDRTSPFTLSVKESGNVTVTSTQGTGTISNAKSTAIFVNDNATVHVTKGVRLNQLYAMTNAKLTLDVGVIITGTFFTKADNIAPFLTGKALQRCDETGTPTADEYVSIYQNYDMDDTGCVIVIEHTSHEGTPSAEHPCPICGYDGTQTQPTEPENPNPDVAEVNGTKYKTLAEAIKAANGADIKLLTIVSENVVVDGDSIKAGVILGNGATINAIPYPSNWVADRNGIPLTMEAGEITLKDGALAQFNTSSNTNGAIALKGGTLTVADTVTKIIGSVASESGQYAAIEATGGVLDLQGNTLLDGGLTMSGDAQLKNKLTAGTFTNSGSEAYSVSVEGSSQYTTVFDLLETGYAFAVYNEDALTGDVIAKDTTTRELTEDVAVIKCTHKDANNKSLFKDNTCTGCGFTCAHETVEKGVCTVCGAQMVAQDNIGKYYIDLAEAFEGVADGGTVTMLTTLTDDDTISFCCDAEGNPVEKTVTLMMNGQSLSFEGASPLHIQSGKLIIGDEVTISQPARAAVPAVFVDNNEQSKDRGTLEFKGKANLTGGLLIQNWGKLEGGLKEGTIITSNGTYSVSVERSETYSNVLGLLGDGLAFAKKDHPDELVNGNVKQLTEDVIVVAHKHSPKYTQNPDPDALQTYIYICDCGFVCPHDRFTNSICDICHAACTHDEYTRDDKCARCGAPFAVRVECTDSVGITSNKLYMKTTTQDGTDDTLRQVFNEAADGSTITLLANGMLPSGIYASKTLTLDLNGHSLSGYSLNVGGLTPTSQVRTGNLTVIDSSGGNGAVGVTVRDGGTLVFDPENDSTTLLQLEVWGGKVELHGGKILRKDLRLNNSITLGDLLPQKAGLAYYCGDTQLTLKEAASKTCDLVVKSCAHGGKNGFDETATACPYCNAPAVAETALNNGEGSRLLRRFANLQTAIDADRDGGATLQLLADVTGNYTIDGTQDTGLDLNGHYIKGTVTVKAAAGNNTTTLSNTKNITTASIDAVVAHRGAKLAGSKYPAVIGVLTLADTTQWKDILQQPTRLGFRVTNADGTHQWYAPNDVKDSQLNNVIINSLPITTKTLNLKVDGKNLTGSSPKVERGTTVQLCASCNAKDADVSIYTGEIVGNNVPTYSQKKATYQKIGTNWYYVVDLPCNTIGKYSVYFTATKDGYTVQSSVKTLTVTKPNLSNAEITFPDGNKAAFNYRTATDVPMFVVTYKGQTLEKDKDFTITGGGSTYDVGPCTLTIKATDNSDYTGSKSAQWTVRPLKVAASVGDIIKTYDGTTNLPENTKITFTSADSYYTGVPLRLAKGTDYEVSNAHYDSADASETEKTVSFTIELKNAGYVFEDGTTQKDFTLNGAELNDKTFKINPAAIDPSDIQLYQTVFNDLAKTYKIDLNQFLDTILPEGGKYGDIQYGKPSVFMNSDYYPVGGATIGNGNLSLSINKAASSNQGDEIGTVTVQVETTNYQPFTLTIHVSLQDKLVPVLAEGNTVSASEITYGQTLADSKLAVNGTMKDPNTSATVDGTFTWTDGTIKPDAGSYDAEWTFTPAEGYEEYATATGTVTVKVKPAKLIVSVKASSMYYTGEEQIASIIASGQSVDSTPVTFTYSDKVDGNYTSGVPTFTDAGTYTAYYKAEAANHEPATGTFTVTIDPLPISLLSVSSISKTYDGSADVTLTADKLTFFSKTAKATNIKLPDTALTFSDAQFTSKQEDGSYLPSPEVGNGKALSFTMTLTSNNYVFEGKSEGTTKVSDVFATDDVNRFTITKAAAPTVQPVELTVINGLAKTYLVNLPALPTLGDNCKYGSIKYEACNFDLIGEGGYANSTAMITSNDEFQLTVPAVESQAEGSVGTVGVKITTDNYQDMLLTVEVIAKNKIVPVLDGEITATPITYGDTLSKSEISGKMKDPNTGAKVEGTFSWQQPDNTILDASTLGHSVEWTFTPAAGYEEYATATGTVTVKVNKADPTFNAPTAQENLTYTGQEQALITAGSVTDYGPTMQYSLTENGTYSQNIPTGTDAGTYNVWYRVFGDANHNDTKPASVAVRIGQKPLTITGVTAASKHYDGTKNADITRVTFDNVTLKRDTDYTVTASFDDASVGSGKNVTATVTLMGQAANNYALEQSSFPTTGSIIKAAAPDFTKETALTIVNGHEKTYTVTLPALPTLETPKAYGALTYEIGEIKLNDGYYTSGAKVENGELTLPIQKNDVETTGSVGTVTVVIKSANYEDITLTVNVSAKNKLSPVLAGTLTLTPIKITYGEALSKIKITGTMKAGDTVVEGTFSWQLPSDTILEASTSGHDVGWTFTPKDGNTYTEVTGIVKVPVAPKSIEGAAITLEKYEFQYNAAEQSPKITGVTLENWDETGITYDIKSGDKATDANDSISLTIEGTGNYTGTAMVEWKITPKTVTPAIEVASCTYTGDALEPTVTLKDGNEVIPTDEYTVEYSNNTNAGTGRVTIKDVAGGNYVIKEKTQDFTITKAAAPAAEAGSLTITNGLHETYSLDLSMLLPKLTAPCDYGTIIYDKKIDTHLGVGTFITLVNGKTGELTLEANRSGTDEGQFGTITVTISTSNYQDITLTINVSAKNRITPTGTPTLSKNAITYGDALNTIALSGKLHDNVNNVDVDGTFEWVDGTHIPVVGNGTYAAEWIFEPTDTEKYLTVSGRSNITVEKTQQYGKLSMAGYTYGKTPSTPTLTDRTGDLNAQVTYSYAAADSGSVQTWDISNPPALNAGTYRMYASIGDTDNYYGFEAVYCEFVVAKATPTYTVPTGLTAKYGQTLADVTLPDGWSWMDSSESVGGASTAAKTFQAKFTPKDTENYNTVENIELEVTVNKADGGNLKTVELTQKYTDTSEHTYTPDWLGLPDGQTWSYSSEHSVNNGSKATLTKQDIAAANGKLTYAISGGKAGDKITITLKASCNNYEDFTITLTITLTARDDQKPLTITGDTSVIYGEKLTLTTTGGSGTGAVTYRIDTALSTGEATIDPETGVLTPVKVGSVSVIATKAGDNDYNDVTSTPFVLMIKPATPTGEPKYTAITTSGKTLKDAALTIEGSTLSPNDGKLEWVDDKGNVLPDSTRVEANTTYKWHFTPTDTNYTTLTGEVELYHKSSSSGGWYDSYYTIKATAGTGGSISPSGNVSVREGKDQTFTITPDKGYAVSNVKIDGKSIGAVKSYTFENVRRTHTIEVIFMKANGNPQTGVFVDVATGSYYEDAVDWAVGNGITQGTDATHFSPDGICTRAQTVTFLWRAAGSPKPETRTMPFTDIPAGSYYYDAVLWAVENGITKGTSDTTFSPNMTCTRAQIVAFLWRSEKSPAAGSRNPFADVKSTAYYADAVLWAVREDITKGTTNTTFSPNADCTRAQIVTFLWRCKK